MLLLKRQLKAIRQDIRDIFADELGKDSKELMDAVNRNLPDDVKAELRGQLTEGTALYKRMEEYFDMLIEEVDRK